MFDYQADRDIPVRFSYEYDTEHRHRARLIKKAIILEKAMTELLLEGRLSDDHLLTLHNLRDMIAKYGETTCPKQN